MEIVSRNTIGPKREWVVGQRAVTHVTHPEL